MLCIQGTREDALKIGIAQINSVIGDFTGNSRKILAYVRQAAEMNADLVVFPEMSLCGYPPMDLLDHDAFVTENIKAMRWLQKECPGGIAVAIGYVDRNRTFAGRALMNVVSVLKDGKLMHTQAKTLLPSYDVFDETRYFEPAKEHEVFEYCGEKIGIAICEDIWWETEPVPGARYPVDPVKDLLDRGATLIIAPSASPFYSGKAEVRLNLISKIGQSSGVPVVYVNTVGGNDSLIFDGHSLVTSRDGKLIFEAKQFEEELACFDMSGNHEEIQLHTDLYGDLEKALVLGIKDYLGKCGFTRVHLGLSGGIDSALVAILAEKAVGKDRVMSFSLPSRYSSEGSLTDARELAHNIGIGYAVLPIEEVFASNLSSLAPFFKGKEPDITEENLQARIRGTLLMAYSNKWDSLLLATGNKSELATGYCTLYGDMCGGLAVIGDLFKTEVYGLCRHINAKSPVIPEAILVKPPSAELRPNQKDEDSLPPYDVLDRILRLYLLDNKTAADIVAEGNDAGLVHRVLTLVGRSEYKRRQAPPVLKVSPRAFGTGRRMPLARRIYEA